MAEITGSNPVGPMKGRVVASPLHGTRGRRPRASGRSPRSRPDLEWTNAVSPRNSGRAHPNKERREARPGHTHVGRALIGMRRLVLSARLGCTLLGCTVHLDHATARVAMEVDSISGTACIMNASSAVSRAQAPSTLWTHSAQRDSVLQSRESISSTESGTPPFP